MLKDTLIISIDFSVNSPAMLLYLNDDIYFYSFFRKKNYTAKSKVLINFIEKYVDVTLMDDLIKGKDFIERNKIEMADAIYLNNTIVKKVIDFIKNNNNIKDIILVFEGFSYNSIGNRTIQLVLYQSILRYMFINYLNLPINNIFIFTPQTIKKYVGEKNRNKDKEFMVKNFFSFIQINTQFKSKWFNHIKENLEQYKNYTINKKHIVKPFDDLVDSFWILKCFFEYNSERINSKINKKK
jgi:hypothetical protein